MSAEAIRDLTRAFQNWPYKQLRDFRDGHRGSPIMAGLAAVLDDQQMADLARYYASRDPGSHGSNGAIADIEDHRPLRYNQLQEMLFGPYLRQSAQLDDSSIHPSPASRSVLGARL